MKSTDSTPDKDKNPQPTTTWKRGAKVTNSSDFGQETVNSDTEESAGELSALELLKQKKKKRLQETETPKNEKPPAPSHDKKMADKESDSDVEEDEAEEMIEENAEEQEQKKPKKTGNRFFISIIVVLLLLLGGAGYTVWVQKAVIRDTIKTDPYAEAEKRYNDSVSNLTEAKLKNLQVEQDAINLKRLQEEKEHLELVRQNMAALEPRKQEIKDQTEAVKGDMLSYYKRYRASTQKQARGMFLDQLLTRSGKQYLEVSINRCMDNQISITHTAGATRIPIADLPTPLLDTLAYTNPFDDIVLEEETIVSEVPQKAASQSGSRQQITQKKAVRASIKPQSYEPPVGKPNVKTPTHFDQPAGQKNNGNNSGIIPMDDDLPDDLGLLPELKE